NRGTPSPAGPRLRLYGPVRRGPPLPRLAPRPRRPPPRPQDRPRRPGHPGIPRGEHGLSGALRRQAGGAAAGGRPEKAAQGRKRSPLRRVARVAMDSRADAAEILRLYNWYVLEDRKRTRL